MKLGHWTCNHSSHAQINPYLYSPSTKEITMKTKQYNAMVCNPKEPKKFILCWI